MGDHYSIQACGKDSKDKGQPLYMLEIMGKASNRKREQSILKERREVRHLQHEDKLYGSKKSYVSSAYKGKLKNDIKWLTNSKEHKTKNKLNNMISLNTYIKNSIHHSNQTNWIKESKKNNLTSKNILKANNNEITFDAEKEKNFKFSITSSYLKIPEMTEKIKSACTTYFD